MTTDQIVRLAQVFGAHKGIKISTVSSYAANDGKLFSRFEKGLAGCTLKRAQRLIQWFDRNWPVDLAWPSDIPRPAKREDAA